MKILNQDNKPCGKLEWLPTWEGVLMYDPEDLKNDRPVRLWHVVKHERFGNKTICYEIKPTFDGGYYQKKRSQGLAPRCIFQIRHQGRQVILLRAHATMLAYFGFAPSDRWEWVIDHINCNTLDDRPSNLQVIPRRENILRSKKLKEYRGLSFQEKHRRSQLRIAWKERMRPHVIAALGPGATAIDVEMELTQLLNEHVFDYGLTPNPSPKGEGIVKGKGSRN